MAARADSTTCDAQGYLRGNDTRPFFVCGDALAVLGTFPAASFDCCMTSPPYWGHRRYGAGGLGEEVSWADYVGRLCRVLAEVRRVLAPTGSLWLNLGDSYVRKSLVGLPWRVAFALTDDGGWILRNSVIWHKVKGGPDNTLDKLRNVHEVIFHLVKQPRYFYDADSIRLSPHRAQVRNGSVISATGVTGIRYRRQIELSTDLSVEEKERAVRALDQILGEVRGGKIADFRMILRGRQRTTHSESEAVSGRAKQLARDGFYFLKYDPRGAKPKDVWDVLPEDTQARSGHYGAYPEDLCRLPILATCPIGGVVLDPFCGTGTTNLAAFHLGRKSVGIDISADHVERARVRTGCLL